MRAGFLILLLAAAVGSAGCASAPSRAERAERVAIRGGLEPLVLRGGPFALQAFAAVRDSRELLIFIDGDGSPWVDEGRRIASDPSPRQPLALELAARTPGSVLYLGRPCYWRIQEEPCASRYWTSQRYSRLVVASLVAAATAFSKEHGFARQVLIGYSGGGALAVLMAPDMPAVVGVVTIAGNLDPDRWARVHGYLPLSGSLNPALEPALPPSILEWHLVGGRDANVPYSAAGRFLDRVPPDRVWRYPSFDHHCCWVREWPAILGRIQRQLAERVD